MHVVAHSVDRDAGKPERAVSKTTVRGATEDAHLTDPSELQALPDLVAPSCDRSQLWVHLLQGVYSLHTSGLEGSPKYLTRHTLRGHIGAFRRGISLRSIGVLQSQSVEDTLGRDIVLREVYV
jgi:hypothetical protein